MPAISSAMHTAALLTRVHVTIHSSTRRLAKLLHIGKSRAHAICNPEKPESITLADLLALGLAGSDEPRAIAVGILRDVAEYIGAHDEIVREHRDAADDSQLSLFSEDV